MAQIVGWEEIDSLARSLAEKIAGTGRRFSDISTFGRGGLVPARLVADYLDIRRIHVDVVHIDSLFVDDIYDSGRTFQRVLSDTGDPGGLVFATLYARRGRKHPPQLVYARETDDDSYVVFPWDRMEHGRSGSQEDGLSP